MITAGIEPTSVPVTTVAATGDGSIVVQMPFGAEIVRFGQSRGEMVVWAIVDADQPAIDLDHQLRAVVTGQPLPEGWNEIPGARGCTPQSCGFRDHFAELKRLGVARGDGAHQRAGEERDEEAEPVGVAILNKSRSNVSTKHRLAHLRKVNDASSAPDDYQTKRYECIDCTARCSREERC